MWPIYYDDMLSDSCARKFKTSWSSEPAQDLKSTYGINIRSTLTNLTDISHNITSSSHVNTIHNYYDIWSDDGHYDIKTYNKIKTYACYQNTWSEPCTSSAANYWTTKIDWFPSPPLPISERFRQILQSRQAPMLFLPSRTPVKTVTEERELRARETLRRILGDNKFQRFLRNGFISVQGKSGKIYQIYPGHGMTIVYDRGTPIEKLCVVLRGDFTATDSLITRYVMILHDEQQFRSLANIWKVTPRIKQTPSIDARSLPEILHSLKVAI